MSAEDVMMSRVLKSTGSEALTGSKVTSGPKKRCGKDLIFVTTVGITGLHGFGIV